MKRILLVCCLFGAPAMIPSVHAQKSAAMAKPTISKNDFYSKMGELSKNLGEHNTAAAKATFDALHQMMGKAISMTHDRTAAIKGDAEKKMATEQMTKQRAIYGKTLQLKDNLEANKDQIMQNLQEFGATLQ